MKKFHSDLWNKKIATIVFLVGLLVISSISSNVNAQTEQTLRTDGKIAIHIISAPIEDTSEFIYQIEPPTYYDFVIIEFVVFNATSDYPLYVHVNDNVTRITREGVFSYLIQPNTNTTIHFVLRSKLKILYSTTFIIIHYKTKKVRYIPIEQYLRDLAEAEQKAILLSSMLALLGLVVGFYSKKYTEVTNVVFLVLYSFPLALAIYMPYLLPLLLSAIVSYVFPQFATRHKA